MKKRSNILVLLILVVSFTIYLFSKGSDSQIQSTEQATESNLPDDYLENLKKYRERFELNEYHLSKALESVNHLKEVLDTLRGPSVGDAAIELKILHQRSIVHVEEIMKSISNFQEYPNFSERDHLEKAVSKLEAIDQEIMGDSLKYEDIYEAFDYTLNTLAKAEINLSKAALKTDQRALAEMTLRQAQIHIKKALLLDYFSVNPSIQHKLLEAQVYQELDSLLENKQISLSELASEQARLSNQLDELIEQNSIFKKQ